MDNIDNIGKCSHHVINSLFPDNIRNRNLVIGINIVHILGVLFIQVGVFLPPYLLKYYLLYLAFLLVSYILLNNRCFMTVLSNNCSGVNYNSLCIKMKYAKLILGIYLSIAVLQLISGNYLFNCIKQIINSI
jgi:hypothetical protein